MTKLWTEQGELWLGQPVQLYYGLPAPPPPARLRDVRHACRVHTLLPEGREYRLIQNQRTRGLFPDRPHESMHDTSTASGLRCGLTPRQPLVYVHVMKS